MAYAALLSLSQTLDQIVIREQHTRQLEREKLVSLQKYVGALQTFVEEFSHKCTGAVNPLESRIITVAHHAEDIIEFRFSCHHFFSVFCIADIFQACILRCWSHLEINSASLRKVLKKMDLLLVEAMKIEMNNPTKDVPSLSSPSLSANNVSSSSDINTMVLEDDFSVIKERIYARSRDFKVIPIIGMGGIGKSTLAQRLYEDCVKHEHFDRCMWVVVSQTYTPNKLFTDIVLSMRNHIHIDKDKQYTDVELKQIIYQELFRRKYVIVVDDLWSEKPWDDLNLILPKDLNGSRVLVTTRLSEVANYVGSSSNPPHEMQLLNEFQSWTLFEERVFGKGFSCPSELEQIGKNAVKSCWGLPLTIVVISGLLKGHTTKEFWERISENICSPQPTITLHSANVLSLSYNHLPLYLKPCFLYVTAFPEDYEIEVNRLIRLWMAEGFVKPSGSKLLEEVAEGYLRDLVGRSLLMVSKKTRYSDRIKTIRVHDVLRDFGISTAQQDRFYFHNQVRRDYRRVMCPGYYYSLPDLLKLSKPATRSVLVFGTSWWDSYLFGNLRLLRVLDASKIFMAGDVSDLVHLRYLSIRSRDYSFLDSSQGLQNIQTLIIDIHTFNDLTFMVPLRIWTTPSLRHLILSPECRLQQPFEDDICEESSLHTITVTNLLLTKKVCEMLLNLRKLRVSYCRESKPDDNRERGSAKSHFDDNGYSLINLAHLQKLEKLTISSTLSSTRFSDLALPKSLKKLSLDDVKGYWKDLSAVGSLPNLEVLELNCFNSGYQEGWEPIEGEFLKLKHLKLEYERLDHWEAESVHFPSLEILVLTGVAGLQEIPSGIGEIDTLRVIELVNCTKFIVDSAKQIQANQWAMGNQDLQLLVAIQEYAEDAIYKEIRPENY